MRHLEVKDEQGDQLVLEYLRRAGDIAHRTLRSDERLDFLTRLRMRIDEHRAEAGAVGPAQVRKVLDRFGDPVYLVERERQLLKERHYREITEPDVAHVAAEVLAPDSESTTQPLPVIGDTEPPPEPFGNPANGDASVDGAGNAPPGGFRDPGGHSPEDNPEDNGDIATDAAPGPPGSSPAPAPDRQGDLLTDPSMDPSIDLPAGPPHDRAVQPRPLARPRAMSVTSVQSGGPPRRPGMPGMPPGGHPSDGPPTYRDGATRGSSSWSRLDSLDVRSLVRAHRLETAGVALLVLGALLFPFPYVLALWLLAAGCLWAVRRLPRRDKLITVTAPVPALALGVFVVGAATRNPDVVLDVGAFANAFAGYGGTFARLGAVAGAGYLVTQLLRRAA